MLDDPARGGQERERTVADKNSHVFARTAHRPEGGLARLLSALVTLDALAGRKAA